jgi:hypothetical protein
VAAANTDPKSCPRVAPAPTKPNNLAPDSLSITSIILAHVEEIATRLSNATQRKNPTRTEM